MKKWIRLLGSAVLLIVLARVINWGKIALAFHQIDWRLWALALAVVVGAQVVSSWRWLLLARVLHFDGTLRRFSAYYFIGMLFNLVLPTSVGGDVIRAWYLAASDSPSARAKPRRLEAFLTVFADRFTGVLVLILLACVSTGLCYATLPIEVTFSVAMLGAGTIAGLLFLGWLAHAETREQTGSGVLGRMVAYLRKWTAVRHLLEVVRCYWRRGGVLLLTLVLSLVVQLASVLCAWLVMRSLGLTAPFFFLGVVMPLVSLITLLPISFGGMGLRECSLVVLLAPLGMTNDQAVSTSLLQFALTVVVSLAAGLGCYLFGRFPSSGLRKGEEHNDEDSVRRDSDQGRKRQPPAAA